MALLQVEFFDEDERLVNDSRLMPLKAKAAKLHLVFCKKKLLEARDHV